MQVSRFFFRLCMLSSTSWILQFKSSSLNPVIFSSNPTNPCPCMQMNRLRKSRSSSGVMGLGAQSGTDGVASQSNPAAGSLPSFSAFGVPSSHGFRPAFTAAGVPPAVGFIPAYPTGLSSTAPSTGEAPTASCGGRNRRPPVAPSLIGVGMDSDIELTDAR
jgi:hypothetical protein